MSFLSRIIAFFMSIIAFLTGLFSGGKKPDAPAPSNPTEYVFYDYAYGLQSRQTLDLALPENASGETGLILFIHGGAWIMGDKDQYRGAFQYATDLGFAAAAINYRYVSDTVNMSMLMDDVASALAKIKALAEEKGIRLGKVLLTGSSAGAHMSLLYAYKYYASSPIAPAAVVSYCGPTDLTDADFIERNELGNVGGMIDLLNKIAGVAVTEADYRNKTGRYEEWLAALRSYSPLYHVGSASVPTAIGHGRQDTVVPFADAVALDEALTGNGVAHDFVVYPNSGHMLDGDPAESARMNELLISYAQTYLK